MAPLPKRKHSVARKNKRRATKAQTLPEGVICKNCGKLKLSHRTCPYCNQ